MRYAVYFTWNDGTEDSFNCTDRADRDLNIHSMIARNEFEHISYCKIYKNGEYGKRVIVFDSEVK